MEHQSKEIKTTMKKKDILRLSNKESNRITRECLQTALIALMSQKSFDSISISEIVRRSGVSRTAFYRNYNSKDDILNEVCNVLLDALADSFVDFHFQNDPRGWYYNFFRIIKEHAPLFRLLLQAHSLNTPVFSTYSIAQKLSPTQEGAELYRFLAWEGALSTIAVKWFQNDMKESVDFMADFCAETLL